MGPQTATARGRREDVTEERNAPSKRDVILDAARRVFLDVGYGAASMDAIAREAGVSKQTIYAHFGAKDALFGAIMVARADHFLEPLPEVVGDTPDVAAALEGLARRYLEVLLAPEAVARFRVVLAESGRFPELAEVFYRSGPRRAADRLSAYLAALDAGGVLCVPDPETAASQFLGALRGDVFIRYMLGLGEAPSGAEIDRNVAHAVGAFLAAHDRR